MITFQTVYICTVCEGCFFLTLTPPPHLFLTLPTPPPHLFLSLDSTSLRSFFARAYCIAFPLFFVFSFLHYCPSILAISISAKARQKTHVPTSSTSKYITCVTSFFSFHFETVYLVFFIFIYILLQKVEKRRKATFVCCRLFYYNRPLWPLPPLLGWPWPP